MLKKIISLLFLALFTTNTVFAHTAAIKVSGESKYKAVRLTPEIYNNANSDLSDILIKNSNGENVPYFINSCFQDVNGDKETYEMDLINSYTKDNSFYFDYKLKEERESDTIAVSIEFSTDNTSFVKLIDIYGSYDNINWEFIQSDKLYDVDDIKKLYIELNKPQKYTHYRFKLANNMERISFTDVRLAYNSYTSEKIYFIESITPEYTIEEKDKTTYISIDGLSSMKICDITIETDSMFKRMATAYPAVLYDEIYNLSINGETYADTTIYVNYRVPKDDTYTITIENNDDKPIDIKGIVVTYYADEVVFAGNNNEEYTLHFGDNENAAAPVYDIASYKNEILKGAIGEGAITGISFEDVQEVEPVEKDYKFIFNIVVVAVTILLGGVALFSLNRVKNKGEGV